MVYPIFTDYVNSGIVVLNLVIMLHTCFVMQGRVLTAIADAVQDIAQLLRSSGSGEVGTTNKFGDEQLEVGPASQEPCHTVQPMFRSWTASADDSPVQVDIAADDIIFNRLRESDAVATASSEEKPEEISLGGRGYSVCSAFFPVPLTEREDPSE